MSPFREQNSAREVTEHSWYLIFGFLPDVQTLWVARKGDIGLREELLQA